MNEPERPAVRRPATSDPPAAEENETPGIETDHLLEEVQEANAKIPDPAERERVIPSRPC